MTQNEPSSRSGGPVCSACGGSVPVDAPGGNCPACLWSLVSLIRGPLPGTEGAGRRFGDYELVKEIARGGMGVVWRARQPGLRREVALKMILAGQLATSAQVLRFYTEARAAARLDHPNIVPLYEIGEEEGCHFYSMRLMEGRSLAATLKEGGAFSREQAARVLATVARAVHFAHQRGVLHRDLKPSNILLDAAGEPHVVDFGLARIAEEESGATKTDAVLGTPAYMAPEQASGPSREVTTAADVYALGAVLYELLTGKPPFQAETPYETLRLVVEEDPRSPRSIDSGIDRNLEVICLKCLQKQPERRFGSALELAADLDRWLAGKPILARPASSLERLVSWARRKPELAISLAALSVVLAVALGVSIALFLQARRDSEARAVALRSEECQRLAFQSLAAVETNPGQALILALESASKGSSLSTNNALLVALEACRERRRLLGHSANVVFTAFSPDEDRVVTASDDRTARIWNASTGETLHVLAGHEGKVVSAVFSPDGKRVLTASEDATARIWDAGSGAMLFVISGHSHELKRALFSPDGRRVATVSQNTARIWDANNGGVLSVLDGHSTEVTCAAFSPDGEHIVTGETGGTALVWETRTGTLKTSLLGQEGPLLDVVYSANGKRIAAGTGSEARVWDASTGAELSVMRGHQFVIYSVALSPDGSRLATGSEDFTARIWDADTGRELHVLPHRHKVIHLEISRDGVHVVTASYDKSARVWDLQSGRLVAELKGHAAPINFATFSADGIRVATACVDYSARIWTIAPSEPLLAPSSHDTGWVDAEISPDGKTMVGTRLDEPVARVNSLASRSDTVRLEGHEDQALSVSFSPDGSQILTTSEDRTARLWDARTGQKLHTLSGHTDAVLAGSFSSDGRRVLTTSSDRTARVWSTSSGMEEAQFQCSRRIVSARFSPDGERVLLADEGWIVRIAEVTTGKRERLPRAELGFVSCADFGPEGRTILTTSITTRAHIRQLPGCEIVATLIHPVHVRYAVYSPDRRWIATGATDASVRIWDTATREKRLEIRNPGHVGCRVSFSTGAGIVLVCWVPEGERYARAAAIGAYPLDVLSAARGARPGDFTPDERDNFELGSVEERRAYRAKWSGGHIYGEAPAASH